jgi:hypothetical protein
MRLTTLTPPAQLHKDPSITTESVLWRIIGYRVPRRRKCRPGGMSIERLRTPITNFQCAAASGCTPDRAMTSRAPAGQSLLFTSMLSISRLLT